MSFTLGLTSQNPTRGPLSAVTLLRFPGPHGPSLLDPHLNSSPHVPSHPHMGSLYVGSSLQVSSHGFLTIAPHMGSLYMQGSSLHVSSYTHGLLTRAPYNSSTHGILKYMQGSSCMQPHTDTLTCITCILNHFNIYVLHKHVYHLTRYIKTITQSCYPR